jgi:hypothetical protein
MGLISSRALRMSIRLLLTIFGAFLFSLSGCAHRPPEYRWVQAATSETERDRDLAAARTEAWKSYPEWKNLPAERQAALKRQFPKKSDAELEEHLAKMRHSVESLYMEAHGWHLVTVDSKGRLHSAHPH